MNKLLAIGLAGVALHLVLREIRKKSPDVTVVDHLPFNYDAMTVPPVGIFIRRDQASNAALINHELVHWQQYQRMGLLPFYWNYLAGQVKGYDANPMEMEARVNESQYCRDNYTQCVRTGRAATVYNPNFRL